MSKRVIVGPDENGLPSNVSLASTSAATVTPNDGTVLQPTRAIYVGGTGDLAVAMADGSAVTLKAIPVGYYHLSVSKVMATGTTATNIVALY